MIPEKAPIPLEQKTPFLYSLSVVRGWFKRGGDARSLHALFTRPSCMYASVRPDRIRTLALRSIFVLCAPLRTPTPHPFMVTTPTTNNNNNKTQTPSTPPTPPPLDHYHPPRPTTIDRPLPTIDRPLPTTNYHRQQHKNQKSRSKRRRLRTAPERPGGT